MQSLDSVPRLMADLRAGRKRYTIRWQEAPVRPGPLRYVNSSDAVDTVTVCVTRVITLPLSAVAAFLNKADEWPDQVLLAGMREHYPDIELGSQVEVIFHSAPC